MSSLIRSNCYKLSYRAFSACRTIRFPEGAITSANDKFSEKERALENAYFLKQQQMQLKQLRLKHQHQKETIDKLQAELDEQEKAMEPKLMKIQYHDSSTNTSLYNE